MRRFTLFLLLALFGSLGDLSWAQDFAGASEVQTNLSVYNYARPGEITISVWVWGADKSGLYEVGNKMTIDKLLTLTGGPDGLTRERRQRFNSRVKLYRESDGLRRIIYEAPTDSVLIAPRYPALQTDDVLVLQTITHQRLGWREGLQIFTSFGTAILVVERLINFFN